MKQNIMVRLLTLLLSSITIHGYAQPSLFVSTGANFYITSGTFVYIDGLQVKPSINYNITGENSVRRDATATPPPPTAYIQRVYHLLQTLPAYSGDITIYYQDSELNGQNENTLNLNVYNGSTWNAYTATARDAANNFVTTTGLSNIAVNQATLAAPGAALPVTLSGFTVQNNSCTANLKWTTASEQNSKHFEVQHSTDGITFTTKGLVAASGNSNVEKRYSFNTLLSDGNNYFRLRTVDIDGSSEFSAIVSVRSNCNANVISLYPNPARNMVTVTGLNGANNLRLVDNLGQLVRTIKTINSSETINVSGLPAGTYIVQVVQDGKVIENMKVVKE